MKIWRPDGLATSRSRFKFQLGKHCPYYTRFRCIRRFIRQDFRHLQHSSKFKKPGRCSSTSRARWVGSPRQSANLCLLVVNYYPTAFEVPFVAPAELDAPDVPLGLAAASVAVRERKVMSTSIELVKAAWERYSARTRSPSPGLQRRKKH